jgi:asparagine synthase (glutamine-hydrolysing)
MPSSYKIKGTNKKRILKDAFSDLLPAKVFSFGKKGFGIPIALWFRNELRDELLNVLDKESIEKFGLLNFEYVSKLIDEHQSGKQNHSSKLWTLYVFQKWCKKNL